MYLTLEVSHISSVCDDISGNDVKEIQSLNIKLSFSTFFVFHFDISGNTINDLHPLKILLISVIFEVSQSNLSGEYINDSH